MDRLDFYEKLSDYLDKRQKEIWAVLDSDPHIDGFGTYYNLDEGNCRACFPDFAIDDKCPYHAELDSIGEFLRFINGEVKDWSVVCPNCKHCDHWTEHGEFMWDCNKKGIDPKEFHLGMNIELEHWDITKGDLGETAKITLAHLRELPDYNTRLKKMENYGERELEEKKRQKILAKRRKVYRTPLFDDVDD